MLEDIHQQTKWIQYKLTDFGARVKGIREKLREITGLKDAIPYEIGIDEKNVVRMANERCPFCGSTNLTKNGWNPKVIAVDGGKTIKLGRSICKNCGTDITTKIEGMEKNHQHFKWLKGVTTALRAIYGFSLRIVKKLFYFFMRYRISHESIRKWEMVTGRNARDIIPRYGKSGIYCYDEQHVRIKGKKRYRQTVYDGIYYEVVNERVCDRIDEETISDFLIKTLGKRKVFAIISDGGKGISRAIKKLERYLKENKILSKSERISHQRCIFHLLKDFNKTTREVEKINKRKKAMGKSIKGIEEYSKIRTLLHLAFSLDNEGIVKECMDELPEEREWIKKILDKDISKEEKAWKIFHCIYGMKHNCHPDIAKKLDVIHDKWENFTYFYIYEEIPKTNDPLEQYYAQTHPMLVKKQFKTDEGLEKHLLCKALFNNAIGKNVTLQGIKENLLLAKLA